MRPDFVIWLQVRHPTAQDALLKPLLAGYVFDFRSARIHLPRRQHVFGESWPEPVRIPPAFFRHDGVDGGFLGIDLLLMFLIYGRRTVRYERNEVKLRYCPLDLG